MPHVRSVVRGRPNGSARVASLRRLAFGACLALAWPALPVSAGVRVTEPLPARTVGSRELEIGSWFSVSSPTQLARESFDPSNSAGVIFTAMETPVLGVGLEVGYARWPSPPAGAVLDQLITALGYGTVQGTEVTLSALRAGLHARVVVIPAARLMPWLETGVGINRVKTRIEFPMDQMLAAGWTFENSRRGDAVDYDPDFTARAGIDLKTPARVRLGFDVAWQWMLMTDGAQPFTTFAVESRLMWVRW